MSKRLYSLAILFVSAILAACGSSGSSSSTPNVPSSAKLKGQITLGAVLPLTGPNATLGVDQQRGIDLAVANINSGGGVLGKQLVVKTEDSQGTPESTVQAAQKLVTVDHVPVVIGEYSSSNTIPMGKYLEQQRVVLLNPGSSSPDVAKIGHYTFSTLGLDNIAGKFAADTIYKAGFRSASMLGPNNAYGQGLLNATKTAFERRGGKVTTSILYTQGQSDYRPEIQRLAQGSPQVYLYTGYGTEAATIIRQSFELGLNAHKFFCLYTTLCVANADRRAVEGQYGMDLNFIGPSGQAYEAAYKKKYNEDFASSFNGYTYDAVMLAAAAIRSAGSTEPAKLRDALATIGHGYHGVTGDITFDSHGQRESQPYQLTIMKAGKVTPIAQIGGPTS